MASQLDDIDDFDLLQGIFDEEAEWLYSSDKTPLENCQSAIAFLKGKSKYDKSCKPPLSFLVLNYDLLRDLLPSLRNLSDNIKPWSEGEQCRIYRYTRTSSIVLCYGNPPDLEAQCRNGLNFSGRSQGDGGVIIEHGTNKAKGINAHRGYLPNSRVEIETSNVPPTVVKPVMGPNTTLAAPQSPVPEEGDDLQMRDWVRSALEQGEGVSPDTKRAIIRQAQQHFEEPQHKRHKPKAKRGRKESKEHLFQKFLELYLEYLDIVCNHGEDDTTNDSDFKTIKKKIIEKLGELKKRDSDLFNEEEDMEEDLSNAFHQIQLRAHPTANE